MDRLFEIIENLARFIILVALFIVTLPLRILDKLAYR